MRSLVLLLSVLCLVQCKKKSQEPTQEVNECDRPSNANFKSLRFTDQQGNLFLYDKGPASNDLYDDWRTDKTIPCYYYNLMDNSHGLANDTTSTSDTILSIIVYPNPILFGRQYLIVQTKKPMLMHLLTVDEDGNKLFARNVYIGEGFSSRLEDLVEGAGRGYGLSEQLLIADASKPIPNKFYRLYYYFSTKENKRFGEGYGDFYIGNYPGFVY